jgi:hypothetical protein
MSKSTIVRHKTLFIEKEKDKNISQLIYPKISLIRVGLWGLYLYQLSRSNNRILMFLPLGCALTVSFVGIFIEACFYTSKIIMRKLMFPILRYIPQSKVP